jgi:PTH1 family peptidyl-tRNA hydrolase
MYLIVGLGNPGNKYAGTRHNVGFLAIEKLCSRWGIDIDKRKFEGLVGGGRIQDQQVVMLKPETFMNRSGSAVRAAMDFYKLEPKDLVIIYDDMALPVGKLRIRERGSAGGHNGVSDVIRHAGTDIFGRIRIGIGSPPPMFDAVDYVLGRFGSEDLTEIGQAVDLAADAVETILTEGFLRAMEKFNRTPKESESQDKR